jgi:imidazoleglycerol-phosphate dehydratase/histidinol-phosphatase
MLKKILFIDRDGTIINEPEDEQIDSFEKLSFLPGVISELQKIIKVFDFELVLVTNQDGLGTSSFPEETFWPVQNFIIETLKNEGIEFSAIHIDRHYPKDNSPNRKPGTGMLTEYINGKYDLASSFVIGDRDSDVTLANNLGTQSIFIGPKNPASNFVAKSWSDIFNILRNHSRTTSVTRKTKETDITISLILDGTGENNIQTGLSFFDHMLEQIARHGYFDLDIKAEGDLHVDEHHTIEDVAIVLGMAFEKAIGNKIGLNRYGFSLPMDEAEAHVLIDFSGRPWLVWDVEFKREKIGDMPTEMFVHFFKSFSDAAKCNLNIKAKGQNEHHKIEAVFKAFARAIKAAINQNEYLVIPSSKGSL